MRGSTAAVCHTIQFPNRKRERFGDDHQRIQQKWKQERVSRFCYKARITKNTDWIDLQYYYEYN